MPKTLLAFVCYCLLVTPASAVVNRDRVGSFPPPALDQHRRDAGNPHLSDDPVAIIDSGVSEVDFGGPVAAGTAGPDFIDIEQDPAANDLFGLPDGDRRAGFDVSSPASMTRIVAAASSQGFEARSGAATSGDGRTQVSGLAGVLLAATTPAATLSGIIGLGGLVLAAILRWTRGKHRHSGSSRRSSARVSRRGGRSRRAVARPRH